jgi:hypothetical protein
MTASSKLEREQDHLIDAPFVLADARAFKGLEHLARSGLELVPNVTPALEEKW